MRRRGRRVPNIPVEVVMEDEAAAEEEVVVVEVVMVPPLEKDKSKSGM